MPVLRNVASTKVSLRLRICHLSKPTNEQKQGHHPVVRLIPRYKMSCFDLVSHKFKCANIAFLFNHVVRAGGLHHPDVSRLVVHLVYQNINRYYVKW
jgi:hypothetical protein